MVRTGDGLSSEKSFTYYIQCIQYPDNKNARNQNHSKQKSATLLCLRFSFVKLVYLYVFNIRYLD